jgi:hypothetical protein
MENSAGSNSGTRKLLLSNDGRKVESAYALFHEVSRLPPDRRRTFVENASGDPEIGSVVNGG